MSIYLKGFQQSFCYLVVDLHRYIPHLFGADEYHTMRFEGCQALVPNMCPDILDARTHSCGVRGWWVWQDNQTIPCIDDCGKVSHFRAGLSYGTRRMTRAMPIPGSSFMDIYRGLPGPGILTIPKEVTSAGLGRKSRQTNSQAGSCSRRNAYSR